MTHLISPWDRKWRHSEDNKGTSNQLHPPVHAFALPASSDVPANPLPFDPFIFTGSPWLLKTKKKQKKGVETHPSDWITRFQHLSVHCNISPSWGTSTSFWNKDILIFPHTKPTFWGDLSRDSQYFPWNGGEQQLVVPGTAFHHDLLKGSYKF